jgi:hypothetical protein
MTDTHAVFAANQQQFTRIGCGIVNPPESDGIAIAERPLPLFRLYYRVEIRHLPNHPWKIPNRPPLPISASKTRLWQL